MGIHDWSYSSAVSDDKRLNVPHAPLEEALKSRTLEVELGYDEKMAFEEAQRCLNCDVQTVFTADKCIECDACVDICPVDCLTMTENEEEEALRQKLTVPAENLAEPLYVSEPLQTERVMVKDEDVCLHCGLCAERCPTSAWDMQKYSYHTAKAGAEQESPALRA